MRPAGMAHSGFFPLPEGAVKTAMEYLITDVPDKIVALDPCVGEGDAFKMLLNHLGAAKEGSETPYEQHCAAELCKTRGQIALANLPGINIATPADFIVGTTKPNKTFSFIYVNSPYADELGGGYRVEASFADKATELLCMGGVALFVVPEDVWEDDYNFRRCIAKNYVDVMAVYPKPEDRPYNETLIFGVRKDHGVADWSGTPKMQMNANPRDPYKVPGMKHACRNWHKTCLTEDELKEAMLHSEIERFIDVPDPIKRGRPPLALGEGHNGMLVASGQAPPVVVMRDGKGRMLEIPHLVRGVSRKATMLASDEEEETENGTMIQKQVYTETFVLNMTVLSHTGDVIHLKPGSAETAKPEDELPPVHYVDMKTGAGTVRGQHGGIAV